MLFLTWSLILVPTSVLTMYEKSAGKGTRHAWTSKSTSIGALSYVAVRCYQHARKRVFLPMECVATRTTHFSHLSSLAFLCVIPGSSVQRSSSNLFVELQPGIFCDLFNTLLSENDAVLAAAKGLLTRSRKHAAFIDGGEE